MDQHEARVARSKASIVRTVVDLIAERGVRAVTVDEVAAAPGHRGTAQGAAPGRAAGP